MNPDSGWCLYAPLVRSSLPSNWVCRSSERHRRRPDAPYGSLTVIENVFHYKQIIPLHLGENAIGRYQKGNPVNCPIETVDPSVDLTHCHINVSRDKNGKLKYVLRDGPSYTGTFVGTELLGDRERRVIYNETLFTLGATTVILNAPE